MSKGYMGNFTMHLDMLGAYIGGGSRSARYNGNLATWRSDSWFNSAFGFVDA